MKIIHLIICCFLITACASHTVTPIKPIPTNCASRKNPINVALFTSGKNPGAPYKILGSEKVSAYNGVGIKRQEAHIHEAMRNLAANLGGDAVIDIKKLDNNIIGTVIAFEAPIAKNNKV